MESKRIFKEMWENSYVKRFLSVIFCVTAIVLLSSCDTKNIIEYRDRDVVKYNTVYVHDTLVSNVHDSIYHTVFQKGDTVY